MDQYTLPIERIGSELLRKKIVSPAEASLFIKDGMAIGLSGFAGAGDAKAVPLALAERVQQSGEKIRISVFTGASLGLAVETALSDADLIEFRAPY
ncbi:MAG: acetyl-CoA hydrolase, partial [Christensenellaceae bacterium]|nr:acetyl-CoA hydrolase [Christensenellaceae bacterium]